MDINNYSYINYNSKNNTIAEYENGKIWIYFDYCVNFFGEKYYTIDSIIGNISEIFETFEEGARFWNDLVDDESMIPLF